MFFKSGVFLKCFKKSVFSENSLLTMLYNEKKNDILKKYVIICFKETTLKNDFIKTYKQIAYGREPVLYKELPLRNEGGMGVNCTIPN